MIRDFRRILVRPREMHQIILTSIYILVTYLVTGGKRERAQAMPYLAICCGFFGRLSLDRDEGTLLDFFLDLMLEARSF